jgi:hypothetical protein
MIKACLYYKKISANKEKYMFIIRLQVSKHAFLLCF